MPVTVNELLWRFRIPVSAQEVGDMEALNKRVNDITRALDNIKKSEKIMLNFNVSRKELRDSPEGSDKKIAVFSVEYRQQVGPGAKKSGWLAKATPAFVERKLTLQPAVYDAVETVFPNARKYCQLYMGKSGYGHY